MAKIKRLERYAITQREYHRHHQWVHNKGLYIPHKYSAQDNRQTWGDHVGFILNGRQVLVAFNHPRGVHADKMEEIAFDLLGDLPEPGQLEANRSYYERLNALIAQMHKDGIALDVFPSIKRFRLPTYTWVSLCAPMEVHNEEQLAAVADLVRRILKGQTTLQQEFGEYRYTRENWLPDYAELKKLDATS